MLKRKLFSLLSLSGLTLFMAFSAPLEAQDSKSSGPDNLHALDLRARKADEKEFTDATKQFGVEVYSDDQTGNGIYISETGSVAVTAKAVFKAGDNKAKKPKWQHAMTLSVRKAGEKEFTKDTRKVGIEVFRNENNGDLVYITENGQIDVVPSKYAQVTTGDTPKKPKLQHAMELKVRKAGEKDFTKDTRKVGVEVFLDENNGTLVYLSETGSVAVAAAKLAEPGDKPKDPVWKSGMEVQVRKAGEKEFSKDTKKYGIEMFVDENNGNQLYICETGDIAVVPGKWAKPTPSDAKGPEFKHAMELSVRKAGEKEFAKTTKKVGIEVYSDENNGNLIYFAEGGDFSVVSPKAE
jgi:hypothetical protein